MRIALAQFNPVVGDISANTNVIKQLAQQALNAGADILVTPELAITGYPPEDLLLREAFYLACDNALKELLSITGITLVVGHPSKVGHEHFNTASVIRDGKHLGQYHKMVLPNNEVFDECRYFSPGAVPLTFEQQGVRVGVLICEDIWFTEPAAETAESGADVLLVLNASPFERHKYEKRLATVRYRVEETGLPCAYVNLVGGQDELVFDGASFIVNRQGKVMAQAEAFQDVLLLADYQQGDFQPGSCAALPHDLECLYQALILGLKDYVNKNGFPGVILGLSGGIDSALTLAIAVDALGSEHVQTVMMPSPYTASISLEDARQMARNVNVAYHELAIWPIYESLEKTLSPLFTGLPEDSTEENLQARIRGTLLMALSNKTGKLVVTTGNKSELATGYCTLYGDMAGSFALLKDVPKTLVFALSHWRNQQSAVIPERIITRPPSAELKPDQSDQDSLPPYPVLDGIIDAYMEQNLSAGEIVTQGYATDTVKHVLRLLRLNEYKRRQAPIGPRITCRAFGKDWRLPITNRFG